MNKHNTVTDKQLLDEAYKCSHLIADQTEKAIRGDSLDVQWILIESRKLAAAIQELECRQRGQDPKKLIG